jgi:hypothetical protein
MSIYSCQNIQDVGFDLGAKLGACLLNELFSVGADRNSSRRHAPCAMKGLGPRTNLKLDRTRCNVLAECRTLKSDGRQAHIVTQIHSFICIFPPAVLNAL